VGSNPAGRAKIQALGTSKPGALYLARPLRDELSTAAQVSSSRWHLVLSFLAVRDAQDRPRPYAIEHPIGKAEETSHIGACVELGHCSHGVTEQGATVLLGDAGGA